MLYLTIQNVLLLLCDHLPSDSGLPVRVTGLLSTLFDLISYYASKIFVSLGQMKIGDKNKFPLALRLKLHSWLLSQYDLHFEIHQGTKFWLIFLSFSSKILRSKSENRFVIILRQSQIYKNIAWLYPLDLKSWSKKGIVDLKKSYFPQNHDDCWRTVP